MKSSLMKSRWPRVAKSLGLAAANATDGENAKWLAMRAAHYSRPDEACGCQVLDSKALIATELQGSKFGD